MRLTRSLILCVLALVTIGSAIDTLAGESSPNQTKEDAITGEDYEYICRSGAEIDSEQVVRLCDVMSASLAEGYATGREKALEKFLELLSKLPSDVLDQVLDTIKDKALVLGYCAPKGTPVIGTDVLLDYLQRHPEARVETISEVHFLAYSEKYPCVAPLE